MDIELLEEEEEMVEEAEEMEMEMEEEMENHPKIMIGNQHLAFPLWIFQS